MLNKNTNELTRFDSSTLSVNVGEEDMPAPIHLELTPIAEVLSESAWGPSWDIYGIDARQRNLKEALNYYPVHIGAHIDNGIVIIDNYPVRMRKGVYKVTDFVVVVVMSTKITISRDLGT